MYYNSEIGKIYDTIYYCIEYFNKHEVETHILDYYPNAEFMFECFEELNEQIPHLPSILEPFFYYKNEIPTAVSCFFAKQIDFEQATIDHFVSNITANASVLYQNTIDSIFHSHKPLDTTNILPAVAPAIYIQSINDLDCSTEFKLQVSLLLGNFNYAISQLVDTLKQVYSYVDSLHCKYKNGLSQEYANIFSNDKAKLYHQFFKFDSSVEIKSASISLLNQYVVFYQRKGDQVYVLVGLNHEDALTDDLCEDQITVDNFMTTCGNEFRMSVIHALISNRELTTSQMAKMIGCPVTTLIKHIEVLRSNRVIYISRRSGLQIFYQLNSSYFKYAKTNMDKLFHEIFIKGSTKNEKQKSNTDQTTLDHTVNKNCSI